MSDQLTINGESPVLLTKERYVLGRSEECDLLVPEGDSGTSRRHAVLERDEDRGWTIIDLGSRNGTYVNGSRVRDRRRLVDGNEIVLGTTRFKIAITESETGAKRSSPPVAPTVNPEEAPARLFIPLPDKKPYVDAVGEPCNPPSPEPPISEPEPIIIELAGKAGPGATPDAMVAPPALIAPPKEVRVSPVNLAYESPRPSPPPPAQTAAGSGWRSSTAGGITAALMLISLFMPWVEVRFGIFGGSGSYMKSLQLILELSKNQNFAQSFDLRLLFTLLPGVGTAFCFGGFVRTQGLRGIMLVISGSLGLAAFGYLFNFATGNGIDASELLGFGFLCYGLASLAALIIGIGCLTALGEEGGKR